MRLFFCLVFLSFFILCFSREKADSTKTRLKVNGNISLNSNGMAPIPSFSLGKPAVIGAFALNKGRFSYDPQIAYSLELKPWIIDNWLHYRLINKPSFELRTGIDISMFFSEYNAENYPVWQGQRYIALEIAGIYKFSSASSIALMYWSDNGLEEGTISGHLINLVYDRSDIALWKNILLSVNCQLFYINYTGDNDGLFISPKISLSVRNVPLSLFFQVTQALTSNISPDPGFRWNLGLSYIF